MLVVGTASIDVSLDHGTCGDEELLPCSLPDDIKQFAEDEQVQQV